MGRSIGISGFLLCGIFGPVCGACSVDFICKNVKGDLLYFVPSTVFLASIKLANLCGTYGY